GKNNIKSELDSNWNFDHGLFIPLLLLYPEADIPVVELSIDSSYDPQYHFNVGLALESLRNEGILIIGSGQITHNGSAPAGATRKFVSAIDNVIENCNIQERNKQLIEWEKLTCARDAHAQEDHLVPI